MTIDATPRLPAASTRSRAAPASPIRKLMPFANAAVARGVRIHHLNIGQPDFATPEPIRAAIRGFARQTVAYAPSQGLPEAIAAWAAYYRQACGVEIPAEQLLVTAGGSEASVFAMLAVADPGDEILVFDPSYTNYCSFAPGGGHCRGDRAADPRHSALQPQQPDRRRLRRARRAHAARRGGANRHRPDRG